MKHKDKILELRQQGLTYDEIRKQLGCSKGLISYHCGDGQKEKNLNRAKKLRQNQHPILGKIYHFRDTPVSRTYRNQTTKNEKLLRDKVIRFRGNDMNEYFTVQDVLDKFGEKPKCYLTGIEIDIYQPRTYEFDHKIPKSRGGNNSIDNLGICTKNANQAKRDMTPEEFVELCQRVVDYNKKTNP